MEEKDEILGNINVIIELTQLLNHFIDQNNYNKDFTKYLQQYLDELALDLTIPAEISLEINLLEDLPSVNSFELLINNTRCRLPIPTIIDKDVTAKDLARSIVLSIQQNRELFFTVPFSNEIKKKWLSENNETDNHDLPEQDFHDFLLSFIHMGFRINRGKSIFKDFINKKKKWDTRDFFEKAISGFDTTNLKLILYDNSVVPVSEADDKPIAELFQSMSDGFFYELGINIPNVRIDTDNRLEKNEFRMQLNDLRLPSSSGIDTDQFLVNALPDQLSRLNLTVKEAINPANGNECTIVQEIDEALEKCKNEGFIIWGPAGFIVLNISAEIRKNADIFLTSKITDYKMNQLKQDLPDLIDAVLNRFDLKILTGILRNLLEEQITIRDIKGILESLLAINGTVVTTEINKYIVFFPNAGNLCPVTQRKKLEDLDIVDYSNLVRMKLKRYISYKFTRGRSSLVVYLLDPQIETRIMNIDKQPLTDDGHDKLIKAIYNETKSLSSNQNIAILTNMEIRKRLYNLIRIEFPNLPVLCYQELSPEMNIQPIARISWN